VGHCPPFQPGKIPKIPWSTHHAPRTHRNDLPQISRNGHQRRHRPGPKELVDRKTIRIVDILFVRKGGDGEILITEIDEMEDVDHSLLDASISEISGLISEEDIEDVAAQLDNGSFAAVMLFENTWATTFRDAVLNANGQLLLSERIPTA
jgi:hypothetical protein